MKSLRILVFLIVISSIVLLYFFWNFNVQSVICSKVKIGTIRDSISGNVHVIAEKKYIIKSSVQGIVSEVAMQPYEKSISIESNQTILQLDVADLNLSLSRALEAEYYFLEKIKAGNSAALQLEIEEQDFISLKLLYEEGDISKAEIDRKANLVDRLRIQFAHEQISLDEGRLNHSININNLRAQINTMRIVSPIDGQLISSNVKPGDLIFPGHHIATVISSDRIIEASLNEEDFSGLKEGLLAGITLFAIGDTILDAQVSRFSTNVNPSTGRRIVYLEITDKSITLPPGASGRVEIIKHELEGRKLLPRKALIGNSVFVVNDGKVEIRDVIIGAKNLMMVEIIEGLNPNDIVVIETPHLLREGQNIRPILIKGEN